MIARKVEHTFKKKKTILPFNFIWSGKLEFEKKKFGCWFDTLLDWNVPNLTRVVIRSINLKSGANHLNARVPPP